MELSNNKRIIFTSRNRKFKMSDSEVMTILILFHLSRYRDLKAFYLQYITHSCRSEFPHLVS
ncbi:IS982 family transposase, partial [Porphyromonas gingivalis]|nr:IS982 family transposase [Porphyromonas gingivalis]